MVALGMLSTQDCVVEQSCTKKCMTVGTLQSDPTHQSINYKDLFQVTYQL